LTIDFAHAAEPVRRAFEFPAEELRDLLCQAGSRGLPLMVWCERNSLTLISTSQHHVAAFRPVLARVRERAENLDGWRALPVRLASGSDAGRQLLRQALPSSKFEPEIRAFVRGLREAAELSATCSAFSAELGALVRMTEHAAERVWEETRLGRPGSSEAEIELETLVAERIAEEELVAWQSSYPALRSSRRPVSDADIGPFDGEERHSMVRMRAVSVLTKFRSA
jgi:hypothetical protein